MKANDKLEIHKTKYPHQVLLPVLIHVGSIYIMLAINLALQSMCGKYERYIFAYWILDRNGESKVVLIS